MVLPVRSADLESVKKYNVYAIYHFGKCEDVTSVHYIDPKRVQCILSVYYIDPKHVQCILSAQSIDLKHVQ